MLLARAALACSLVVGPAYSDVRGGVPRLSRPSYLVTILFCAQYL